jgi:hypothetical protein
MNKDGGTRNNTFANKDGGHSFSRWREFPRGQLSPRAASLQVVPLRARRAPLWLAWTAAAGRAPATSEFGTGAAAVRGGAALDSGRPGVSVLPMGMQIEPHKPFFPQTGWQIAVHIQAFGAMHRDGAHEL